MKYNRQNQRDLLRGPEMRQAVTMAAGRRLAKARALVGHRSGKTAASGRLVHGYGGKGQDRVKVTIEFGGAAVEEQWGNSRRPASRFLTRALEGE